MAKRSVSRCVCVIKECFNPVHGNSMCTKHLSRFRKHGDVMYGDERKIVRAKGYTLEERFWSKVDKDGPTMPNMKTPCWEWVSAPSKKYGQFGFQGEQESAHRWSYRITHKLDAIPEGMLVCHECDNPRCVRPEHLFLGTPLENMRDKIAKGRAYYPRPVNQARGECVNTAKLTAEDVRQIREVYKNAASTYGLLGELGRAYGVGRHTIFKAVHGKSWKHVA